MQHFLMPLRHREGREQSGGGGILELFRLKFFLTLYNSQIGPASVARNVQDAVRESSNCSNLSSMYYGVEENERRMECSPNLYSHSARKQCMSNLHILPHRVTHVDSTLGRRGLARCTPCTNHFTTNNQTGIRQ